MTYEMTYSELTSEAAQLEHDLFRLHGEATLTENQAVAEMEAGNADNADFWWKLNKATWAEIDATEDELIHIYENVLYGYFRS